MFRVTPTPQQSRSMILKQCNKAVVWKQLHVGAPGVSSSTSSSPFSSSRCCTARSLSLSIRSKVLDVGPTRPGFRRFFFFAMAAHAAMMVTMSIGATQFLQGFIQSGNPITLWMAKDILPALISVTSISLIAPEKNVKLWFVVGYALTCTMVLAEFVAPLLLSSSYLPFAGTMSSLAKSLTQVVLQVCRATILEQYAMGNNFGTLLRVYTNGGTVIFAVFFGLGLVIAHTMAWAHQLSVMAVCSLLSIVFASAAVRFYVPRHLTVPVVLTSCRHALLDIGGRAFRVPSPEDVYQERTMNRRIQQKQFLWSKLWGFNHRNFSNNRESSTKLRIGVDVSQVTSSQQHFESVFVPCPSFKCWISIGCALQHNTTTASSSSIGSNDVVVLLQEEATLTHILGLILWMENTTDILASVDGCHSDDCESGAAAHPIVKVKVMDDATLGALGEVVRVVESSRDAARFLLLAQALEEKLRAAGWQMNSESLEDSSLRLSSQACDDDRSDGVDASGP